MTTPEYIHTMEKDWIERMQSMQETIDAQGDFNKAVIAALNALTERLYALEAQK